MPQKIIITEIVQYEMEINNPDAEAAKKEALESFLALGEADRLDHFTAVTDRQVEIAPQ